MKYTTEKPEPAIYVTVTLDIHGRPELKMNGVLVAWLTLEGVWVFQCMDKDKCEALGMKWIAGRPGVG
jgi:hypothetical protein